MTEVIELKDVEELLNKHNIDFIKVPHEYGFSEGSIVITSTKQIIYYHDSSYYG